MKVIEICGKFYKNYLKLKTLKAIFYSLSQVIIFMNEWKLPQTNFHSFTKIITCDNE